jgi:peptidoglycan/xylan/chitin deacetylase (PgdA/CDA1 family)
MNADRNRSSGGAPAASHAPRRRVAPVIGASIGLHLAAAGGVLARPGLWPYALSAVLADHLLLTAAGLWPRSRLLGPNWTHLPGPAADAGGVAITIDDGPDAQVTPRVLALLEAHHARATFFCVGELVERHAALARDIVSRGHAIENHSHHHPAAFSLLGPAGMAAEIGRAQDCITQVTGESPRFFRAPAGLRNPFLEPVLSRMQLQLASWTRRGFDTVTGDADAVYRRLASPLQGGDILILHDRNGARDRGGEPVILSVLPRLLDSLQAAGLEPVTLRSALPA